MKIFLVIIMAAVFCCAANARPAAQTDVQQIRALLSSMFDKPESKVLADPIIVSGQHAIADWTQGDMGGRALLRKKKDKWTLVACAGDGLKEANVLESTGISKGSAARLAQQLARAEAKVPEDRRSRFSLFGPMADAQAAHSPDSSHKH